MNYPVIIHTHIYKYITRNYPYIYIYIYIYIYTHTHTHTQWGMRDRTSLALGPRSLQHLFVLAYIEIYVIIYVMYIIYVYIIYVISPQPRAKLLSNTTI